MKTSLYLLACGLYVCKFNRHDHTKNGDYLYKKRTACVLPGLNLNSNLTYYWTQTRIFIIYRLKTQVAYRVVNRATIFVFQITQRQYDTKWNSITFLQITWDIDPGFLYGYIGHTYKGDFKTLTHLGRVTHVPSSSQKRLVAPFGAKP